MVQSSSSGPRTDSPSPSKRARLTEMDQHNRQNGSQQQPQSNSLPPLSLSILGVEPLDEFIKEIADFVHHMIRTRRTEHPDEVANFEVEAKIGLLKERGSGSRLQLPVLVETVLSPDFHDVRFESNMSSHQHKHFNNLLNSLTATSNQPSHPASPLHHSHHFLKDSFYTSDSPRDRGKIRVTRDEKTNTVESMQKIRLGDLNIYSPKRNADWRVSVSVEVPCPHPVGTAAYTRRKDRLSYSHEEFSIDLTQVTSYTSAAAPPQVFHELEVEIARPDMLLSTAARRGDPSTPEPERNAFDELIRAFVNNARILVRNSIDGWQ